MSVPDEIARAAARLLLDRAAADVREAIARAGSRLGYPSSAWPRPALVRRHAQALTEEALGTAGHHDRRRERWRLAEEIMTLLDVQLAPAGLWLVGRAARGHFDADPRLDVRFHGTAGIDEIAALLVDAGFDEPKFETLESRWGRLSRLRFDDGGVECVVTRCPPAQVLDPSLELVTGKPIKRLTLEELRRALH